MSHRAKSVIIDGIEYPSITLAAAALQLETDTVRRRVNSRIQTWAGWVAKGEQKSVSPSRATRRVKINEVEYPSIQAAAKALGLTHNSLYGRITSESEQYAGYQFVTTHPTRISDRTPNVRVEADGETYRTLEAAAQARGVTRHGMRNRMRQVGGVNYVQAKTGEIIV